MPQEDSSRSPSRNGLGSAALILGLVAGVFAFVPIIGEFFAAPAALLALVLGLVGLRRVEKGSATNWRAALAGCILGVVSGFVILLALAATLGPVD